MGATTSLASLGVNLALQRQAQKSQAKGLEDDRATELAAIAARDQEQQRLTDAALKRQLAEQRARAGAGGVGGVGGSSDAVLRGLEEESGLAAAARAGESSRRRAAVESTFRQRRRQSLLEQSSRWLDLGSAALGSGTQRSLID